MRSKLTIKCKPFNNNLPPPGKSVLDELSTSSAALHRHSSIQAEKTRIIKALDDHALKTGNSYFSIEHIKKIIG